jgi:carbon monoxide dehydrogenase subunit G
LNDPETALMEMTGEQHIPAGQDAVWAALNDPAVLKACIPGCEVIEQQAADEYRISMLAAVGPVKARFNGKLAIRDAHPPHGYALSFEGSGGAAGFGRGGATVALTPAGDATLLRYTATAEVSGKLAQVGSRLIDGVARKMAAEFFARFTKTFTQAATAPAQGTAPLVAHGGRRGAAAVTDRAAWDVARATPAPPQAARPVPGAGSDLERELLVWRTVAVVAIGVACLAIGYIIGAH